MEITIRREQFRKKFYEFVHIFALSHVSITKTRAGGFDPGMKLDIHELANKIAFETIRNFSDSNAVYLGAENGSKMSDEFVTIFSYNDQTTVDKMEDEDTTFITLLYNQCAAYIPIMTVQLWTANRKTDLEKEVNAELKKLLKPRAMVAANSDVALAMDTEDSNNPPRQIQDCINKAVARGVSIEVQKVKRSLRKKYSADEETQASTPTKNGRESSKGSGNAQKKSKKKSGEATKPKSALKKGKDVKWKASPSRRSRRLSASKESNSSKSGGGRGGSRKGGAGRGAGRR